jgi:Cu/Ag efflux pump CusA
MLADKTWLFAYRQLTFSDLPTVDFPMISVTANLAGASPETMASSVATPLEKQFSTIAGLDSMVSTTKLGTTKVFGSQKYAVRVQLEPLALLEDVARVTDCI